MSAGIEHLIIHAAGDKRFTYDGSTTDGYLLDDREVDTDLALRLDQMASDGLLVVDRGADGSIVKPTPAGWTSIA